MVAMARNKMTVADVRINYIEQSEYTRLQKSNRISQAEAIELCQASPYVIDLINEFPLTSTY